MSENQTDKLLEQKSKAIKGLKEIYSRNLKDISKLEHEYSEEIKDIRKENEDYSDERSLVENEIKDFLGLERKENSVTIHDDYEGKRLKIYKELERYDKYHLAYINELHKINNIIIDEIKNLFNHANTLKSYISRMDHISDISDFIKQAKMIVEVKGRMRKADESIFDTKKRMIKKKKEIQHTIDKIISMKKKMIKKELHDIKKGENQIDEYKEEMADAA
ncbi:hypothetical protein C0585_07235 [Candidatus Woesearchaeota archaeon]|nr:MAG: hypothetical protein C0585_07235 [Candidatus Woesearchaeota archaeon]